MFKINIQTGANTRFARTSIMVLSLVMGAAPAAARSGKLFSEKSNLTTPLARVPDFAKLAESALPGVVSIQVEKKVTRQSGPHQGDPFFDFFFGPMGRQQVPPEYRNRGLGTGFVISEEGLILTNNHVIEDADIIEVTFTDGKGNKETHKAKVLGTAPDYDVALLQTEKKMKVPITYLGNSDAMKIGDWVMAIGNPFGLSHTVSVGIISAKERREINPSGQRGIYNFLQTDAAINPGNSGGPLINMKGEVIGINSAINAAGSGIGFAIPINMVKLMLKDLKTKGRYQKSWLGVQIQPLTENLAESFGLKNTKGALIADVVAGSPAQKAGIRPEDIILEFGDKKIRSSSDLQLAASLSGIGTKVTLTVWRAGKEKTMSLTLAAYPDDEVTVKQPTPSVKGGSLGIVIGDITPELQRHFGIREPRGAALKEVDRGSPAARAGLRAGDVILSLNGHRIKSARSFVEAVKKIKSGGVLRMRISRQGSSVFVALRKP